MEKGPIQVKMKLAVLTMMVIMIMDHSMEVIRTEEDVMGMGIMRTITTIQDGSTVSKDTMDIMDPIVIHIMKTTSTAINIKASLVIHIPTIVMIRIEGEVKFVPSHLTFKTCLQPASWPQVSSLFKPVVISTLMRTTAVKRSTFIVGTHMLIFSAHVTMAVMDSLR